MATPEKQPEKISNEQIAKAIIAGLISTGIEGAYDSVSRGSGNYPSMGCSQWEGIGEGGRGDILLSYIDGGDHFANRTYTDIETAGELDALKTLLGSEQGIAAQNQILMSDCMEKYLPILATVENLSKAKNYIYAGMWCPTSHSIVSSFLKNKQGSCDIDNLETLRDLFHDEYYLVARVGDENREGYENRANKTYDYVVGLDENISNTSIDKSIARKVANSNYAAGKASDDGFSTKMRSHGKHADSIITKLPKGKTFCEPVYPDLVTVSDKVPPWLLEQAHIPLNKMDADEIVAYSIPEQVLKDACGADLDAIIGNAAALKERQRVFDPSKYKEEFKQSNQGKPANNNDPFPVDLKIEELETHKPTVKIHSITCCPEAVPVAKAVIAVSDHAEKRIVKLENMMATILRNLFRIANRVHINCVYYGGQTTFEKYKGIRCLSDDRINDGGLMSLDQCMNCTRYEPIIGQVYELINGDGANLQAILDDNQMSYMDMQDYVDFTRVERYHNEPPAAKIIPETADIRNDTEKDFKEIWTEGVKMNWDLTPVEEQKPHINWRQSINDDGSDMKKLDSFPTNEENFGRQITAKSSNGNVMQRNADAMNRSTDTVLLPSINQGKTYASSVTDEFINRLKAGIEKDIKKQLADSTQIDPLIIASIMALENASDPAPTIKRYSEVMTELQILNPAIVISAYKAHASTFTGSDKTNPKIPRIDKVVKKDDDTSSKDSSSESKTFNLNWEERESWLWPKFAEPMSINMKNIGASSGEAMNFFPAVCYIYLELFAKAKSCRFDGDMFAFPFFEEQFSSGMRYSSKYGPRPEFNNRMHYGIDIGADLGTEIHAIADGIVDSFAGFEEWNGVVVNHEDNYYSRYLHCSEICVQEGQSVQKGDVIAKVGNVGGGTGDHLHLEIGHYPTEYSQYDPATFFPTLSDYYEQFL